MSKVICKLEKSELDAIRELYEKKLAYENLSKILSPSEHGEMYQRLISDYGSVVRQFNSWWDDIYEKYDLPQGHYFVNFSSAEILVAE